MYVQDVCKMYVQCMYLMYVKYMYLMYAKCMYLMNAKCMYNDCLLPRQRNSTTSIKSFNLLYSIGTLFFHSPVDLGLIDNRVTMKPINPEALLAPRFVLPVIFHHSIKVFDITALDTVNITQCHKQFISDFALA